LERTSDRDTLQNGILALTYIVRRDCAQLMSWTNTNGDSGLTCVLKFVGRLLDPKDSESGGLLFGDLIVHLLRTAGDAVVPYLPDLLKAMIIRVASTKTATFMQSLLIPFALLIHTQRDTVLQLLESTQVPDTGRSGLEVFVEAFCENVTTFQGFYPQRVSNWRCAIFSYRRDRALQGLHVKGNMVIKPEMSNVIVTRSRAKKSRFIADFSLMSGC